MNESSDPLILEWTSVVKDPNFTLIQKCLKMAQLLEYPDLDIKKYIQKIHDIGVSIKNAVPQNNNPKFRLSMLNEEFFHVHEFTGDEDDYYNPKNNFLNDVLEKKSGLPITLSILYVEVAKHLGLPS